MKKILFSLMAVLLSVGLIGAAFAYFSDVETSTGNTFTAGTLNLKVDSSDPGPINTFAVTKTFGGDFGWKDWVLKNTGNLAGSLDITFSNLVDAENGVNEPEDADTDEDGTVAEPGTNGELAEVLALLIYIDEDGDNAYLLGTDTLVYGGVASGIVGEKLSNYAMVNGYDKSIRIEWSIAASVDNEIQSDSAGFDIGFELLQNPD